MATFSVKDAAQLAEFIIPLTLADATQIFDALGTSNRVYAAVYGNGFDGKRGKWSVILNREGDFIFCYLGEYHPRKDGKADIVLGK